MNTIKWTRKAYKQMAKIASKDQQAIYVKTRELKVFPNTNNVKQLKNHQYPYRLRVGNYRVFFEYDGQVKIVQIQEVKKRDERTY